MAVIYYLVEKECGLFESDNVCKSSANLEFMSRVSGNEVLHATHEVTISSPPCTVTRGDTLHPPTETSSAEGDLIAIPVDDPSPRNPEVGCHGVIRGEVNWSMSKVVPLIWIDLVLRNGPV